MACRYWYVLVYRTPERYGVSKDTSNILGQIIVHTHTRHNHSSASSRLPTPASSSPSLQPKVWLSSLKLASDRIPPCALQGLQSPP